MVQELLDPTFDPRAWVPARRRRLLLVAYIDLLLFSVPWALFVSALEAAFPGLAGLPSATRFLVFALIEGCLLRFRAWSPGALLLGIRFVPIREHSVAIDRLWQGLVPYVSRHTKERESWYTLLLATWTLNEGCKSLVRWTLWNPPVPFFGQATDEVTSAAIYLASGVFEVAIAVWLYRVDLKAALVGVPYNLVQLASAVLSWQLWDAWVAEMVVRRRNYPGLPIREGEVEWMQALTPELVVGALAVGIVLLLLAVPRLRQAAA